MAAPSSDAAPPPGVNGSSFDFGSNSADELEAHVQEEPNMDVAPPKHSYTQRYCCTFGGKMHWSPIWKYRFSGAHMVWWTQWPPDRPDDDNSCWRELLKANHWLDQTSREWVGPPSLPPEATRRGRGRVQPGARKQDTWLLLRENPEVFTDLQGNPSPISLVASQVCCDHAGGWLKAINLSKRVNHQFFPVSRGHCMHHQTHV